MPRFSTDSPALRQILSSRDSKRAFSSENKTIYSEIALEGPSIPKDAHPQAERHDSARPSILADGEPQLGALRPDEVESVNSPSGLTEHHLPAHSVPTFINNDIEPLQLPAPLPSASVSVSSNFDIKSLAKAHFLAFQPLKPSPATEKYEWTIEAATKEIKILRKAFPLVDSRNAVLAMCAWFHLFCFFDDATEKMPAKEARLAMKHSMHIIEVACQTKTTSQRMSRLMTPLQRANVQYTLWLSSRLPHGGIVAGATYLFIQHARRLLGPEALKRVANKILEVFQGYYREISCREGIDTLTVENYTQLRASTIGLSPFWEILRHAFFTGPETEMAETASCILEAHVASVVGLQNDLVGMASDRANGDRMNYILLRAERESLSLGQALNAAIESHNRTVRGAVEERRRVERTLPENWKGSSGLQVYADCILGFMTTHFMWASSASRYKPAAA